MVLSLSANRRVSIETSYGLIVVELYDATPKHQANFISLAEKGFYDSLIFHRVISNYMIQAGDPQSRPSLNSAAIGAGGTGYTIDSEINPKIIHKRGALAAARFDDDVNPNQESSGSQFYLVQGRPYPRKYLEKFEKERGEKYTEDQLRAYETIGGAPNLDGKYTVFGEIVIGLNIVEKISEVETGRGNRPKQNIYILSMKVLK